MDKRKKSTIVYLALGSNLGARHVILSQAITQLFEEVGSVLSIASFYETTPWGFSSEYQFLNTVIALRTELSAEELLAETQRIERSLGRTSKHLVGENYTDRTIDIDILFYGEEVIHLEDRLIIPHPLLHERLFVLEPLVQIAPNLIHPKKKQTILTLLKVRNSL